MKVQLSYPWQGPDGVNHRPGTTVDLDRATANTLVRAGRARHDGDPRNDQPTTPEPAPAGDGNEGRTAATTKGS